MIRGIREPINSLPTHMTETMFINSLVTCVVLTKIGEADPYYHALSQGGLDEWTTTHRPKLLKCHKMSALSFEDFMKEKDIPHESAVETLDAFVAMVKKGLSEGDMVKYITDDVIEQARKARKDIERCETRLICY